MSKLTVGIDVGGTFADVLCYDDESRSFQVAKVPTTTGDQSRGCLTQRIGITICISVVLGKIF